MCLYTWTLSDSQNITALGKLWSNVTFYITEKKIQLELDSEAVFDVIDQIAWVMKMWESPVDLSRKLATLKN